MKAKSISRVLAIVLAVIMIVGMLPMNIFALSIDYVGKDTDYYNVISKKDWELAPGVLESEIVLNNDAGSHRQVAHVVEVDLSNPYTKVIPSYRGMAEGLANKNYGVEIMSKQAAYAEANGYGNVVAAMNLSLSWYDSAYYLAHPELVGEPLGYMVLDGVVYKNSQGQTSGAQTCVVINFDEKDGVARPADMPKVEIRSTSSAITGWEEQVIPANFGFLVKDGKNQYKVDNDAANGASRSFVGLKADGTFVMVMNDGRQAPYSTGFTNYEMAEFMLSLGCVVAVNGDGGGSSAFLSQRPGEELNVNCAPSDGAERDTTHGILVISTAPATGEFVRATLSADNDYYTPGSTVKFSAVGSDLVGTAADIPADAYWQLADASFGTIEDGVFVSNGKVGTVTAQMVYNGKVVGEDTINIVMPDEIVFAQENMVIPYGRDVEIVINATYDSKPVTIKADDVEFVLSNNALGTINGFIFSAAQESEGLEPGTITATIGELTIVANVTLGKGTEIAYDFENQNLDGWSIYTNYPQYGPAGPNGALKDANGNYWYHGQNERGYISIVDATTGKVRNGNYALAMEVDFSQPYETGFHALNMRFPKVDTTDAVSVGFWIYVPYDARHSDLTINSVLGSKIFADGSAYELMGGWNYVKIEAPAAADGFYGISISVDERASGKDANGKDYYDNVTEPNLNGKYTFYIDDISIDYSTAVDDRENPVFSNLSLLNAVTEASSAIAGQTITFNNPTIEVRVADFVADNATGINASSVRAYVDGEAVECTYANGKISINGLSFADGAHTVKFEIEDNAGNTGWISGNFTVNAGTDASTIKVVPADPTADKLLIGSLYWMNVVATDAEKVQKVEMTFDLNNASYWELNGMTVAAGFSAEWSVQADENIATITITRTGDVALTGEAVIATFPVRTWESHITEYEGYENQTPATLVSRGILWQQAIELILERGVVTFTDDTTSTFGMDRVLVNTEIFFDNYTRAKVEGAQAWINEKKAAGVGFHEHTVTAMDDCDATCTTNGYTGRTYCAVCDSVIDWGTIIVAEGHDYKDIDGKISCECGDLFNGVYTDGKTYVDGVVVADGWNADNTAYYVDGVKLTGSHFMNGTMYTFDENGVYLPNYIYEGIYEIDGTIMYFMNGQYLTGEQIIANDAYYFDANGLGYDGEYVLCGEVCVFDNGRYASCNTADLLDAGWCGKKAEYVVYADGTLYIGGSANTYQYTNHGNRPFIDYLKDIKKVVIGKDITVLDLNICAYLVATEVVFEEGSKLENISTGAFLGMNYLKSINIPASVKSIGAIAFKNSKGLTEINVPATVKSINSTAFKGCNSSLLFYVTAGSAAETFAKANGFNTTTADFIKNGFVEEGGELYYYVNGVKWTQRGLFKVDGYYYYAKTDGSLLRNTYTWASVTNDLLPKAQYNFDADGRVVLKNGFIEENGELYYYVDGAKWTRRGIFQVGDSFYYAKADGALLRNTYTWASVTNDILPKAQYNFDADGKMDVKNGFVEENGELYYYVKGVKWTQRGFFKVGSYYYYAKADGALLRDTYTWASVTNDLLPKAQYNFDADGRVVLKNGFIEENGEIYYYVDGAKWTRRGFFQVGNDYYYAKADGALLRNTYTWGSVTNDLLPKAQYTFDENGKVVF